MGELDAKSLAEEQTEITLEEIEGAVERVFGKGSVGFIGRGSVEPHEVARATFVWSATLLLSKQRCEMRGMGSKEWRRVYFKVSREVRREISGVLGIDENEVFRLHHHSSGLRAKDPEYREVARAIDRDLADRHGMVI